MKFKKYLRIWWILAVRASQTAFVSRFGTGVFLLGKILRFLFFFLFLLLLASNTKVIAGYSLWQVIFFYLTFNIVDTMVQFFLREVYRFRSYVIYGEFDYILTKPISPLFRSLFGGSDILDFFLLILLSIFIGFSIPHLGIVSLAGIISYILLIFNAFLIALAFHILVLSVGVLTTEVDNTIMLYRDMTQMGRLPIDIYQEPLRGIITFFIPIGVMMTFPAKALMGILSPSMIIVAFLIGIVFLFFSFKFWTFSLRHYQSASS